MVDRLMSGLNRIVRIVACTGMILVLVMSLAASAHAQTLDPRFRVYGNESAGESFFLLMDTNCSYNAWDFVERLPTAWRIKAACDFDKDDVVDLVWQAPTGQVIVWFMKANGTKRSLLSISPSASPWQICAAGDIDKDGVADLIWQLPTGQVCCWFMNTNGTKRSSLYISPSASPWRIRAAGDIDRDGVADLIWQLPTGQVVVWFMKANGTMRASSYISNVVTPWQIRGAGDFDRDGVADLFWQLPTGEMVAIWFMNTNGTKRASRQRPMAYFNQITCAAVLCGDYMIVDLSAGPSASSYSVSYMTGVPAGGWTDEYKTTKMVFRRFPAGTFTMGSPVDELGRSIGVSEDQHQVTLAHPFYIGVFEVTQQQWERVMGTWPSYFTNITCRYSRPVDQVRYDTIRGSVAGTNWPANSNVDADSFMGRLRVRTGKAFDLPTESQWEYAGRGTGTRTALNSGKNLTQDYFSCFNLNEVGRNWYNGGAGSSWNADTAAATAKVGSYLANEWGLYDIHGNVLEWCLDWYPGHEGLHRVIRGGSWYDTPGYCRSAARSYYVPYMASKTIGFRVALP